MERIGDLLPATARRFGLERELVRARASSTWDAIVAEHVPAAVGACRLVSLDGDTLIVEADHPIVGQELRINGELLRRAFGAAPGGREVARLQIQVRRV